MMAYYMNRISSLVCLALVLSGISAISIGATEEETGAEHEGDAQTEIFSEAPQPSPQASPSPSNQAFAAAARIRDERKRFESGEGSAGDHEITRSRKSQRKSPMGKGNRGKEQQTDGMNSGDCWERTTQSNDESDVEWRKQKNGRKHHDDPQRRGKKPDDAPGAHPGVGGKDAFDILTIGASQMMRQWMAEAKRRYPEDFEKLVTEWSHIMVEFDNISFPDTDNQTDASMHMEASDVRKEFASYDSEMGPLPDYFRNARYSVLCTSERGGYEVRKYESTLWINIRVNTSSYDFAGMIAFKRLFEYTQGKNSLGIQIPMTTPLRKQIKSHAGQIDPVSLLRDESFLVSVYLPDEYIHNLPLPLDDQLFLEHSDLFVYVFNFSGWAYGLNVYQKYFECLNTLVENNEPMEEGMFYMQMYDSPWVINPAERHNELLIPVRCTSRDFLSCSNQGPDQRLYQNQIGSGSGGLIKIRTISSRKEVSLQLLLAGVFLVQRTDLNLTESIYGVSGGCFSRVHPFIQSIYTMYNLPYFVKFTPRSTTAGGLDCNSCHQKLYYLPTEIYDNLVQPNVLSEGSHWFDRVNPTLYYVMNLTDVPKLEEDDILEHYLRMQGILQSRGYCFHQDEFLIAYHRDHHSLFALEMFVPVDLNCSGQQ